MKDRIPTNPGRVLLTPVTGQTNTYDLTMADDPTEVGTPLNKATLLKDATAALYGLDGTALPDDVLSILGTYLTTDAVKIETGSYTGTGTSGNANRNSILFTFNPQIVFISVKSDGQSADFGMFREGCSYATVMSLNQSSSNGHSNVIDVFSNKTLTWHYGGSASAVYQLNKSGTDYEYIAIGKVGN